MRRDAASTYYSHHPGAVVVARVHHDPFLSRPAATVSPRLRCGRRRRARTGVAARGAAAQSDRIRAAARPRHRAYSLADRPPAHRCRPHRARRGVRCLRLRQHHPRGRRADGGRAPRPLRAGVRPVAARHRALPAAGAAACPARAGAGHRVQRHRTGAVGPGRQGARRTGGDAPGRARARSARRPTPTSIARRAPGPRRDSPRPRRGRRAKDSRP